MAHGVLESLPQCIGGDVYERWSWRGRGSYMSCGVVQAVRNSVKGMMARLQLPWQRVSPIT
jgi:hypothetical protein